MVDDKLEEREVDEPSRLGSLAGKVSGGSVSYFLIRWQFIFREF